MKPEKRNVLKFFEQLSGYPESKVQNLLETYLCWMLQLPERISLEKLCEHQRVHTYSELVESWDDVLQEVEDAVIGEEMTEEEVNDCALLEYIAREEEQLEKLAKKCTLCEHDRAILLDNIITSVRSEEESCQENDEIYVSVTKVPHSVGIYLAQDTNQCSLFAGDTFVLGQDIDYIVSVRNYDTASILEVFGIFAASALILLSIDRKDEM